MTRPSAGKFDVHQGEVALFRGLKLNQALKTLRALTQGMIKQRGNAFFVFMKHTDGALFVWTKFTKPQETNRHGSYYWKKVN